jgi:hypothetical protein
MNSSGNPIVSYYDSTNVDLKLLVCGDPTCTSRTFRTVDGASGTFAGQYASLRLDDSGNPVITYNDPINQDLRVAVCANATCSTGTVVRTLDGGAPANAQVGQYTSLRLNGGKPVIAYYDGTNQDLKLAVCADATCSPGNVTVLMVDGTTPLSVGQYASLALNSSGYPVISYYSGNQGDLKLAVCNDTTCTTSTLAIIDPGTGGSNAGQFTSLQLNGDNPVISYYDSANGDLNVMVCNDPTCTSKTIRVLDGNGAGNPLIGLYTSLRLNSSGFPVISYYDQTNTNLKLAVCGDATCTPASVTVTTLDGAGVGNPNVGLTTSLALNNDNPVISYYDVTNSDLKMIVCNNPTCTP